VRHDLGDTATEDKFHALFNAILTRSYRDFEAVAELVYNIQRRYISYSYNHKI
jgi:hypothetical protein